MIQKNIIVKLVPFLVMAMSLLPVQASWCQASESTESTGAKKELVLDETKKQAVPEESVEEDGESLSTGVKVGIGVGAVAVIGAAVAIGGGGGGGDDAPIVSPTADSLVAGWHAEGNQPGSGRTYSGTFHLYQGGSLGYDLQVHGEDHMVGGGSWRVNGYQLEIRTDHGSLYSGQFVPAAAYVVINMNSNTGWNLTLTR